MAEIKPEKDRSQVSPHEQWGEKERKEAIDKFMGLSQPAQKVLIAASSYAGKSVPRSLVQPISRVESASVFDDALQELSKAGLIKSEAGRIEVPLRTRETVRLVRDEVWRPQETARWQRRFRELLGKEMRREFTAKEETHGELRVIVSHPAKRVKGRELSVEEILHPRPDLTKTNIAIGDPEGLWEETYHWREKREGRDFSVTAKLRQETKTPLGETIGHVFDVPQPDIKKLDDILQSLLTKGKSK